MVVVYVVLDVLRTVDIYRVVSDHSVLGVLNFFLIYYLYATLELW